MATKLYLVVLKALMEVFENVIKQKTKDYCKTIMKNPKYRKKYNNKYKL